MTLGPTLEKIWTIGQLLEWTSPYFAQRGIDTPRLDAEILLAHVLGCPRIQLYAMYHDEVNENDRARFRELVRQRACGCPIAYLVKEKEFFSLPFEVGPGVLIPRPETELLVEEAIAFAANDPLSCFLDLGTGSGAIAVAIAHRLREARGVAVDRSADALQVARRNAEANHVADRLTFIQSDLFSNVPRDRPFDLIVSNPPYVTSGELAALPVDVRNFEPTEALDGGPDGLVVISQIIVSAANYLRPNGRLMIEIGSTQAQPVEELIRANDALLIGSIVTDYARNPRVIVASRKP